MKRFLVIGLGNFGFATAQSLIEKGNEVIAIDLDGDIVDRLAPLVSFAAVGDGTDLETLRRLGAEESDAAVISTGDDLASSILATMSVRDLGIKDIYVKVISDEHARVMDRMGVTDVVFPERDSAQGLANRISGVALMNFVRLGAEFSAQEMGVPETWNGKTLRELKLRQTFDVSVIAVHNVLTGAFTSTPDPDRALLDSDTLIVAGNDAALARVAELK